MERFSIELLPVFGRALASRPRHLRRTSALATDEDVFLGCNCPTAKNPDVQRCHTVLALKFMQERYPALEVAFPD